MSSHRFNARYARPHVSINARGELTQFTYAPQFEGPLPVRDGPDAEAYYDAYAVLAATVERMAEGQAALLLSEGDVVTFNNRRMLHGRNGFSSPGGGQLRRHLEGCYVSIDEFVNKHQALSGVLGRAYDASHAGNQDQH